MNIIAYSLIAAIISLAFIMGFNDSDAYATCKTKHSIDYCYNELR